MRIIAKNALRLLLFFIGTSLHAVTPPIKVTQKSLSQSSIFHVSKPGTYLIGEHLKLNDMPFIIDANDVTIDLQGNTMDFSKENSYGISFMAGRTGITIKNGTIRNAAGVEAISLTQNTGINLSNLEIVTAGTTALLVHACSDVTINQLTFSGTMLQTGLQIEQCVSVFVNNCSMQNIYTKTFRGFSIQQSQTVVCKNNTINNVQATTLFRGFVVNSSSRIFLSNNIVTMNTGSVCMGISLTGGRHNKIVGNEISMNTTKVNQKHLRSASFADLDEAVRSGTELRSMIKDTKQIESDISAQASTNQPKASEMVTVDMAAVGKVPHKKLRSPADIVVNQTTNNDQYDTVNNKKTRSTVPSEMPSGTLIGICVAGNEGSCAITSNIIKDNIGSYSACGIRIYTYIATATDYTRTLHIEKNEVGTNIGGQYQYGIFDEDEPSNNAYIQNKVLFHGKSLEGSSMPAVPESKANYFMRKNCQISNLIKEAPVDDINFFADDLNNKNLSIY